LLGILRKMLNENQNTQEQQGEEEQALPPVIITSDPSLVKVNAVPRNEMPKIWALASTDAALSYLDPQEYHMVLLKAEIIAELGHMYIPDPDHPRIREMLARDLKEWLNVENAKLYALYRSARNKYGFERRMMTMTAPKWAVKGW